jgi:hypothetical protein
MILDNKQIKLVQIILSSDTEPVEIRTETTIKAEITKVIANNRDAKFPSNLIDLKVGIVMSSNITIDYNNIKSYMVNYENQDYTITETLKSDYKPDWIVLLCNLNRKT